VEPTVVTPPSTAVSAVRASGSLEAVQPALLVHAACAANRPMRLILREPGQGRLLVVVFSGGAATMVFSPGDGRSVGELLLAAGLIDRDALSQLTAARRGGPASLERLLRERSQVGADVVQELLNYQARQRLLDALAWRRGTFELFEATAGDEAAFRLDLPGMWSLRLRAEARAVALPGLLARLSLPASRLLVRRRRGARAPSDPWQSRIWDAVESPLVLDQLVVRLLADDDLVFAGVLEMVAAKLLVVGPRARLASGAPAETAPGPTPAPLGRLLAERLRGAGRSTGSDAFWAVVISDTVGGALQLVDRLAEGNEATVEREAGEVATGLRGWSAALGPGLDVCLLAVGPDSLSTGALEGIARRCDAVIALRTSAGGEAELTRLIGRLAASSPSWSPLVLGVEVGASFRPWSNAPDAVLGLRDLAVIAPRSLLEALIDGLVAACPVPAR